MSNLENGFTIQIVTDITPNVENGFTIQIVTDITPKVEKKNSASSPFYYTMIDLLNVLSGWRAKIVLKVQKRDLKIEKNR
ncbi:hypothetical protein Avbf_16628, partial [Armadillidium vulgare]